MLFGVFVLFVLEEQCLRRRPCRQAFLHFTESCLGPGLRRDEREFRLSYALKFSFRPGRGQRHLKSLPVEEQVTQAVCMSGPPKQMLVVMRSGKG